MLLKNFLQKIKVAKIATVLLVVYAVSLTAVVVFAAFIGPLKAELDLLVKNRALEGELRSSGDTMKGLRAERDRLLLAVKNLQNDSEVSKDTVRALRRSVDETAVERQLAEAKVLIAKLSNDRTALTAKLDEVRKELQDIADARVPKDSKNTALEMSDLVRGLEKEKADLQARVKQLEEKLR